MLRRSAPALVAAVIVAGLIVARRHSDEVPAATATAAPSVSAATPAATSAATPGPTDAKRVLALATTKEREAVDVFIEQTQKSVEKNPKKFDFWILLGRAWVRKARETADPGYYLNADAAADIALELSPDNSAALDVKALVLLNDHKFNAARALAQRTVDKNPDDPTAYGNLADALLELGEYDEASKTTQKMIDLKPNLPSYSRLAHLAWLRGDTKGARESLRLALDSGKDTRDKEPYAWVLTQAATLFLHTGDLEGAEAGFDKALEWFPGFAPANVGKGRIAVARGDNARAKELFERAHKASPLVETAWLLGDASAATGDTAGAKKAYDLVRSEGKRSDGRTLALFLAKRGEETELALSLAEQEMKSRPDIYTEEALALARSRAGKHEEALKAILQARRLGTKEAHFAFHEGLIRKAKGDAAGAKKALEEALQLNPHFDGAAQAKALLGS
jgi:tetratricopeptide (TPR) repeat protein